jgi:hypothetical protein
VDDFERVLPSFFAKFFDKIRLDGNGNPLVHPAQSGTHGKNVVDRESTLYAQLS